jgi:hypothetical protein
LFKVLADFASDMERTTENERLHIRLIGTAAKKDNLLRFD